LTVLLAETNSKFFGRSCADCIAYVWDNQGMVKGMDRKNYSSVEACNEAGSKPWRRPLGVIPPCHECPKIPEDSPIRSHHYAIEPSERSYKAIKHHDECEAVHHFYVDPDTNDVDPIVKRNAAIIKATRSIVRRKEAVGQMVNMASLTATKIIGG
jgi:hypothetical protein